MAEGIVGTAHGQGRYTGSYPIYKREPDETAVAEFGKQIAGLINAIGTARFNPLARAMEAIKMGYADPSEVLVKGTVPGRQFENIYGVPVPERRRPEMTSTAHYQTGTPEEQQAAGEPLPYAGGGPTPITDQNMQVKQYPTGRMVGGWTPRTEEQLKQFIISESAQGRTVPRELLAISGLAKTVAARDILDPDFSARLARIRSNPAMIRAFNQARAINPNAEPEALMDYAESVVSGNRATMPDLATLGPTKDQERDASRERIAEGKTASAEKIAQWNIAGRADVARIQGEWRHKTWGERLALAKQLGFAKIASGDARVDKRIAADKEIALGRERGKFVNALTREFGPEVAWGIAEHLIDNEGDAEDLPDVLKEPVKKILNAKQAKIEAQTEELKGRGARVGQRVENERVRLEQRAIELEQRFRRYSEQDWFKANREKIKTEIAALALIAKDPNKRGEVAAAGKRLLEEEADWHAGEPEGVFAGLSAIANAVGIPADFGYRPLVPPKRPYETNPNAPLNEPRAVPRVPRPSDTPRNPNAVSVPGAAGAVGGGSSVGGGALNAPPVQSEAAKKFLQKYPKPGG